MISLRLASERAYNSSKMDDPKEVIELLSKTLRHKVRPIVLANKGTVVATIKQDGTPQTPIDVEAEFIVREALSAHYPQLAHYGEESGYPSVLPEEYWLLDIIDGTKSFMAGVPAFTAMAVYISNNEPTASVIYDYTNDNIFTAYKGEGAFKNGKMIRIDAVSMPKIATCRERMVTEVNKLLISNKIPTSCVEGLNGAGYGFIQVVDGQLSARFNFPHQPNEGHVHDYAPGALLVQEAGGLIIPVDGSAKYSLSVKSFVACHPKLAPFVRENAKRIRDIELSTT